MDRAFSYLWEILWVQLFGFPVWSYGVGVAAAASLMLMALRRHSPVHLAAGGHEDYIEPLLPSLTPVGTAADSDPATEVTVDLTDERAADAVTGALEAHDAVRVTPEPAPNCKDDPPDPIDVAAAFEAQVPSDFRAMTVHDTEHPPPFPPRMHRTQDSEIHVIVDATPAPETTEPPATFIGQSVQPNDRPVSVGWDGPPESAKCRRSWPTVAPRPVAIPQSMPVPKPTEVPDKVLRAAASVAPVRAGDND